MQDIFDNVANQLLGAQIANDPALADSFSESEMQQIMNEFFTDVRTRILVVYDNHYDNLLASAASAYARKFTLRELREINAFVATKTGQKFIIESSAILGEPEVAAANETYLQDMLVEIEEAKIPLVKALREYVKRQERSKKEAEEREISQAATPALPAPAV